MKCFKNYKQIINSLPIPDFLAENAAINWIEIMLLQCNDDSEKKMKYEIRADKKNLSIDGHKRRHFVTQKIKPFNIWNVPNWMQLEPSRCKKGQKKSKPRNWFGE
jgi:hypothetical protein